MSDLTNQRSLAERWKEHFMSQEITLRGLLIEAVAEHEGWEESVVALVDEAIMPLMDAAMQREAKLRTLLQHVLDQNGDVGGNLYDEIHAALHGSEAPHG